MLRSIFGVLAVIFIVVQCCAAQPMVQKVDLARSRVTFQSSSPTLPLSGEFSRYTGQVAVDPTTQELQQVSFTIDLSNTKIDRATPQLQWLAQGLLQNLRSPIAQFRSSSVQRISEYSAEATGSVTVGAQRHAFTVPIKILRISSAVSHFQGTLNGDVAPEGIPNGLQGDLNFDLSFTTRQ